MVSKLDSLRWLAGLAFATGAAAAGAQHLERRARPM
jgi:hypothetical protein